MDNWTDYTKFCKMANFQVTVVIVMITVLGVTTLFSGQTAATTTTIAGQTTAAAATTTIAGQTAAATTTIAGQTTAAATTTTAGQTAAATTTIAGQTTAAAAATTTVVIPPQNDSTESPKSGSEMSTASTKLMSTTGVGRRKMTTEWPGPSDALIIVAGAAVIIVIIVLVTAICLCCIASRKHKKPPPSDGNFKPNDVRVGDHSSYITNNQPSTTVKNISEHSARLEETATLPSNDPLSNQDSGIYSREISSDGRASKSPNGSHRSSSSNSLKRTSSNGQPPSSRPGSKNIFDKIDPTTEETDELELSPTVSPANNDVEENRSAERNSAADQPQPASRRHVLNPKEDITKRPTPQPRPRLSAPKVEDSAEPESVNDLSPSPASPASPNGHRPFKKGKGPDGSDQAALLANVIRKTPRPVSQIESEAEEGTTYW